MRRYVAAFLAGLLCGSALTIASAFAQSSSVSIDDFAYFYKQPQLERIASLIEQFEKQPNGTKWEAYPPTAGFLAVVFRDHPDQIAKLIPPSPGVKTAEAIVAALQLSGNASAIPKVLPRLVGTARDDKLAVEFSGLPSRIEDLQVRSPTHLDILWGASFASGDPKFVRMIIDYYARTANRSDDVAMDVAKTAIGIAGGPAGPKVGPKYGNELELRSSLRRSRCGH